MDNIGWQHITNAGLDLFIDGLHLQVPQLPAGGPPLRADKEAFLTSLGITPAECISARLGRGQPQPAARVNHNQCKLEKQGNEETDLEFLTRAEAYLTSFGTPDTQAINHILNASGRRLASVIPLIRESLNQPPTLVDFLRGLREHVKPAPSALFNQLEHLQRGIDETFTSFGQRLLNQYMAYIEKPMTSFANNQDYIVPAVLPYLLRQLSQSAATIVRQAYDTGTRSWVKICQTAAAAAASTPRPAQNKSFTRGQYQRGEQCVIHPHGRHTNAQCRTQGPELDHFGFTNSNRGDRNHSQRGRGRGRFQRATTAQVSEHARTGNEHPPATKMSSYCAPAADSMTWWEEQQHSTSQEQ
jgi:hypothetical protein